MKKFLALKASAGSGKTYALTLRYISLLFLGVIPRTILALTFTNKAASEMSQRIFKVLLNLGNDDDILREISKQTNLEIEQIIKMKEKVLNRFLSDELSILTFDKFINKILREFAGYLNMSDNFKLENDDYDLMLYKFLLSLDDKQFQNLIYFSHTSKKKLNAIVELFTSLEDKNIDYNQIIFSEELLKEIENAILINSYAIKEFVLDSNLSNAAFNAVNFNDIKSLLDCGKTWLIKKSLIEYTYFKKAKEIVELDQKLHNIQNYLIGYFKYKEIGTLNTLFEMYIYFKEFRRNYKKQRNGLEFNDVTNLVYLLLQNFINKDFLYFRMDAKYDHIMIDEFQDTSIMQFKILEPLIEEKLSGSDRFKTFFYVGDPKQSIYRFRGGKKELFDYVLNQRFKNKIELQILDINFRSSKSIVEFVNKLFVNLPNYEYFQQKVKSEEAGFVEVLSIVEDDNSDDKWSFLKDKLENLFFLGVQSHNIAILTYTNDDILELYEYLRISFPEMKITTDMTSKLIEQKSVKGIINLIKYYYFQENIYKTNFNSMMSYDYLDEISLLLNIKEIDLISLVKKIATHYNILDESVLQFIEGLNKYGDIVDFIYEIDKDDAIMINEQSNGLQILTIFKSKGLEFDTVILLDRMKNKQSDRTALLFSYENTILNKVYYKEKGREEFDLEYKNAIELEKNQQRDDELNILYVALTRAENNLIVFKKNKQSVFEILNSSIDSYKAGEIVPSPSGEEYKESMVQKVQYDPISLDLQEILEKESESSKDDLKGKYFGLATHYCLEMMKSFDINSLLVSLPLSKNKYSHILAEEDFLDIENRIQILIRNSKFVDLIKGGELTKEQALLFDDELKVIDLLIEKEDKFIVVDYKTTSQKDKSHDLQVKNYVRYVSNISNKTTIGYMVYLRKDEIEICEIV